MRSLYLFGAPDKTITRKAYRSHMGAGQTCSRPKLNFGP